MVDAILGITFGLLVGCCIALPILIIMVFFENEIDFQIFYFVLFLRFLFMAFLWIIHFGAESFTLWWKYRGKEYEVMLPQLSL